MLIDSYNYKALAEKTGKAFDPHAHFVRNLPQSIYLAEEAAKEADSYRVSVGFVFQALNVEQGLLGTFVTWNDKPFVHQRKRCAETKAWDEARGTGFYIPVGQVVKGPADSHVIHSIHDVEAPTLHSCGECLNTSTFYMQEGELQLGHDLTTVTTSGYDQQTQVFTHGELMVLHGYDDKSEMPPEHVFTNLANYWPRAEATYATAKAGLHLVASNSLRAHDAGLLRASISQAALAA